MAYIKGQELMIFLQTGTGSSATYKTIAFATNHGLELSADTADVSNKDVDGGWSDSEVTKKSWSMSSDSMMGTDGKGADFDDMYTAFAAGTKLHLVWNTKSSAAISENGWTPSTTGGYEGKAVITSINENAQNGENTTFSVTFTGCGAFTPIA